MADLPTVTTPAIETKSDLAAPSPKNGGSGPADFPYTWAQTLAEATVSIPLSVASKARDFDVQIKKTSVTARYKNKPTEFLLKGNWSKNVKAEECNWQIDDNGKTLTLELAKENKMEWWKSIIQDHPEIDTSKVVPENSKLTDLDDETRGIVSKMMFDQRQRQMGLPTSEDLQKQKMVDDFMGKNPNFDPSMFMKAGK